MFLPLQDFSLSALESVVPLFQLFCLGGSVNVDDMAQLFWSRCCVLFLMVSYHCSGRKAYSCMWAGIFFSVAVLQVWKSKDIYVYV